jgi:glycine/D-amino acid oxidase-like deaminating enzyme
MNITKNKARQYGKLTKDLEVDVAIIGGGLAGIDTAYHLSETGLSVAVLEAKTIGSGATSKTTAFLTQIIDTDFTDMISMFGAAKTKLVWQAHGDAINTIEKIVDKEKISCNFKRCSNYEFAQSDSDLKTLGEETKQMKSLGFKVRLHKQNKFPFEAIGALEVPNQAKYYVKPFIECLAEKAQGNGVQIFENTKVTKISGSKNITLTANGKTVRAKKIIIATYDPLGNPQPTKFKKGMYISYVMVLEIPKGKIPEALYEDMANPYHYFRIDQGGKFDYMTIGGEDHREELHMSPQKNYRALTEYIKETFPKMKYKVVSQWSGPILEPSDGLPLIGEYEPNKYVVCGFSGNGMTYSMISALILRDLVTGKKNSYAKLFDPKRTPTVKQLAKKAYDYGEEFVEGAVKNFFK